MPFEIPFGFATTFKSDEDWLDEWEELENKPRTRKPYTFDDRVDDYRYKMSRMSFFCIYLNSTVNIQQTIDLLLVLKKNQP